MAYRNRIKFDLSFCNDLSNSLNYHLGMLCECAGNYVYICVCTYMYLYVRVYTDICKVFTRTDLLMLWPYLNSLALSCLQTLAPSKGLNLSMIQVQISKGEYCQSENHV